MAEKNSLQESISQFALSGLVLLPSSLEIMRSQEQFRILKTSNVPVRSERGFHLFLCSRLILPHSWPQSLSSLVAAVVQLLSRVWLFPASQTVARQASLSFTISQNLLTFMSMCQWFYLTISSFACVLLIKTTTDLTSQPRLIRGEASLACLGSRNCPK